MEARGIKLKKKIWVFSPYRSGGESGDFFSIFPGLGQRSPTKWLSWIFHFLTKPGKKKRKKEEEGILGKIIDTEAINSPVSKKQKVPFIQTQRQLEPISFNTEPPQSHIQ